MKNFYFTFGCGSPLAHYFVKIEAVDENHARCLMVCMFSQHWASVYDEARWIPMCERLSLIELHPLKQSSVRLGTNFDEIERGIYEAAYTSGNVVCQP